MPSMLKHIMWKAWLCPHTFRTPSALSPPLSLSCGPRLRPTRARPQRSVQGLLQGFLSLGRWKVQFKIIPISINTLCLCVVLFGLFKCFSKINTEPLRKAKELKGLCIAAIISRSFRNNTILMQPAYYVPFDR